MLKKRIAALAIGASLATSAIMAPQADARPHNHKKDDRPSILKLSSFKDDDGKGKKKDSKKKRHHYKDKNYGNKKWDGDWKKKNRKDRDKDDDKKSSYNLKGFNASSKKDNDDRRGGRGR